MSRTIRFYNKKNRWGRSYHPYEQLEHFRCNCSWCYDPDMSKHRRMKVKFEVTREMWNWYEPSMYEVRLFDLQLR